MKRLYIYLMMLWGGLGSLFADEVRPFEVHWYDGDSVTLEFPLTVPDVKVGSNYAVCITPYLYSAQGDTLRLTPTVFRGKRNRRYVERARYYGDAPQPTTTELTLQDTLFYSETFATADVPWLKEGRIEVAADLEKDGCCEVVPMGAAPVGHFAYVPPLVPMLPVLQTRGVGGTLETYHPVVQPASTYRPYDDTRILRKEKGMLYVNFPLDKSTLLYDFRKNATTLDTIVSITRRIMADSTSQVEMIQIIGMASVEGRVKHNQDLALARAQALQDYVQQYVDIPDSLFELNNAGEGWTEMRDQINDLRFEGREKLLDIIDNTADVNEREHKIRYLDGGRPFSYLKDNVLIDQRNSGYLRVYYNYVPDPTAIAINRASDMLKAEKYTEARQLLRTVCEDPRAWNAWGVALYMTGDEAGAFAAWEKAVAQGNDVARNNLEQCRAIAKARQDAQ